MEDKRNIKFYDNFDKKQFVHFTTSDECDDFIKYIREKQIYISHKCCSGIGCGIDNIKINKLQAIINEFKQSRNKLLSN